MSGYPADQVLSPPDLPPYFGSVYKLSTIVGVPSDEQVIEIHTTIRVANRVVDRYGRFCAACSTLVAFVQRSDGYRSKYPCSMFPTCTTYTPPALPVHILVKLEPISGQPSQEDIIKVQNAIRAYEKLIDIPSLFDPQVSAGLSEHLFDIQMARYIERCNPAGPVPQSTVSAEPTSSDRLVEPVNEETRRATNNAGRATDVVDTRQTAQPIPDPIFCEAIEQSNQLAGRSNQLIERSNQIAEQLTRVVEQSNQPNEQSSKLTEKVTELLERMNQHLEQSNHLAEESTKPVEKLGDVLKNVNKVLVGIQHAIVRNNRNNSSRTVDCLINEKGNTDVTGTELTFSSISKAHSGQHDYHLPVVVDSLSRDCYIPDYWLGDFLRFFGIGHEFRESDESANLEEGCAEDARKTLSNYLSSRLG
ncbi:unnamed protein product [Rhizoctonia solani]|uniref:Uncharacterized protein n=1 Tax=Rhizoctonia solani TaxID=456999 RepID=A0A8H3CAE0_9AGAM|nr:unnamed protein product [Rhizoctonia solani]